MDDGRWTMARRTAMSTNKHGEPKESKSRLRIVPILYSDAAQVLVQMRRRHEPTWEQLPFCEPDDAFRRFCVYRDFGGTRSLRAVAVAEGSSGNNVPGHLVRLSAKFRWVERAAEFD